MIVEGFQQHVVSGVVLDQLIGPRADWFIAIGILTNLSVIDRLHNCDFGPIGDRSGIYLGHLHHHRVIVGGFNGVDPLEVINNCGSTLGISVKIVSILYIFGGKFNAIVEHHTLM